MGIYVAKSGKETGPFTEDQITPMLESGMLSLTDSVWHKELPEWIPVHKFLGVRPPIPAQPTTSTTPRRTILPEVESGEPAPALFRLAAFAIDSVAVVVALYVFEFLLRLVFLSKGETPNEALGDIMSPISFVLPWLYFAVLESTSTRGTLGKMVCGLVVAGMDGKPIGFARATGRYFGKIVSFFTIGVGFLMCAWTEKSSVCTIRWQSASWS